MTHYLLENDLFHQEVFRNDDFSIECDYTEIFPQYYVYDIKRGKLAGMTNARNYMGICRMIWNDYKKMNNYGNKGTELV